MKTAMVARVAAGLDPTKQLRPVIGQPIGRGLTAYVSSSSGSSCRVVERTASRSVIPDWQSIRPLYG